MLKHYDHKDFVIKEDKAYIPAPARAECQTPDYYDLLAARVKDLQRNEGHNKSKLTLAQFHII